MQDFIKVNCFGFFQRVLYEWNKNVNDIVVLGTNWYKNALKTRFCIIQPYPRGFMHTTLPMGWFDFWRISFTKSLSTWFHSKLLKILGPFLLSHENQQSKWFYIKDSKINHARSNSWFQIKFIQHDFIFLSFVEFVFFKHWS